MSRPRFITRSCMRPFTPYGHHAVCHRSVFNPCRIAPFNGIVAGSTSFHLPQSTNGKTKRSITATCERSRPDRDVGGSEQQRPHHTTSDDPRQTGSVIYRPMSSTPHNRRCPCVALLRHCVAPGPAGTPMTLYTS